MSATLAPLKLLDFMRFAELQLESRDMDPAYPVLVHRVRGLAWEEAIRYSLLYCAYYDIGTAELAFRGVLRDNPMGGVPLGPYGPVRIGTERRGLRVPDRLHRHLTVLRAYWEHPAVLTDGFTADRVDNWRKLRTVLEGIPGNARWGSYKTAEVLIEVCGLNAIVGDMGNDGSTGPMEGLEALYGRTFTVDEADAAGANLVELAPSYGVHLTIAQVETVLCNWYSLVDGRYYSGHDIDEQQESIARIHGHGSELWAARLRQLPLFTLGELQGWEGVDKERKKAYRDWSQVLRRDEPL